MKLSELLSEINSDYSTGLLADEGRGFCFTIKKKERWTIENDVTYIPFGGIGGKIERNESPSTALRRESLEEVNSDVVITSNKSETILINNGEAKKVNFIVDIINEPSPDIIYRIPQAEIGRKLFTNVIIYSGKFTGKRIQPIDDPAIIEINKELLLKIVNEKISVKDFLLAGGKINSKIKLPPDGILKPVGTAIAVAICIKNELI